jgi:hypothetical protein
MATGPAATGNTSSSPVPRLGFLEFNVGIVFDMASMKDGAFAIIDCLGFRGIWKTIDPQAIIEKMEGLHQWASSPAFAEGDRFLNENKERYTVRATILSDTIVASVTENDRMAPALDFIALKLLVQFVEEINRRFMEEEPIIPLRGCITFGEHLMTDRFIIGPAVDRAAEYEKLANGAFIWLDPAASKVYEQYREFMIHMTKLSDDQITRLRSNPSSAEIEAAITAASFECGRMDHFKYDVPLKGGDRLHSFVISPVRGLDYDRRKKVRDAYETVMSREERIDVIIKRTHTLRFIDECFRQQDAAFECMKKFTHKIAGSEDNFRESLESAIDLNLKVPKIQV